MKKLVPVLFILLSDLAGANNFEDLAKKCAPSVSVDTLAAIVRTESSFNPYAIGVVGGSVTQPKTIEDAVFIATKLATEKKSFSVGLAQINSSNFQMLNLSAKDLFDPCTNLKAAALILEKCYVRMSQGGKSEARVLSDSLSCYYSGNATTGYSHGYVDKVISNAPGITIPSISILKGKEKSSIKDSQSNNSQLIVSSISSEKNRSLLIF